MKWVGLQNSAKKIVRAFYLIWILGFINQGELFAILFPSSTHFIFLIYHKFFYIYFFSIEKYIDTDVLECYSNKL